MKKEFNLSEKIWDTDDSITVEDVKEFIRLLKGSIPNKFLCNMDNGEAIFVHTKIDKLAGDDLKVTRKLK